MYREGRFKVQSALRRMKKARTDAKKSRKPEMPHTGPGAHALALTSIVLWWPIVRFFFEGAGGRISEKGATLSQYIVQQIVLKKPDQRDKDPRGAILRHAEEAAKNPFYVTPAYKE